MEAKTPRIHLFLTAKKTFLMTTLLLVFILFFAGFPSPLLPFHMEEAKAEVTSHITRLVYPTLGFPQIVPRGGTFTLEFDFRMDDPTKSLPASIGDWKATLRACNDFTPFTADLPVLGVTYGTSDRWPQGSGRRVYEVYKVTVEVPCSVPSDLYDLHVSVRADQQTITDFQPHAVSVVEELKDSYSFIQITDVHVFDIEYPTSSSHDREIRNAVYLKKAIDQINLIHPDFVVITGDTVYGQRYMPEDWPPPPPPERSGDTEYEYEYNWAYEEFLRLEVPTFMIIGNHDGYYDTVDDGYNWWVRNYGPLFYSFDYGDSHFTMINTMDWAQADRTLYKQWWYSIVPVLEPGKWQGQALSGGDKFDDSSAPPPANYGNQLGWIRDDLAAHQNARLRFMCSHHDPATIEAWKDENLFIYETGGRGEGRRALLQLAADYRVHMYLSGHEHHDRVVTMDWSEGGGATIYANTTCLQPISGESEDYPGYRLVEIQNNAIVSYNYLLPKWSYPYYDGVNVGGTTNLDNLYDPAISCVFSNGEDWGKKETTVQCMVSNNLQKAFTSAYVEFHMPVPGENSYYRVSGADSWYMSQPPENASWVNYYVRFQALPSTTARITLEPAADTTPPSGWVRIEEGAERTSSLEVSLTLGADDPESGVRDMMISNYPDFRDGVWEPFRTKREWKLLEGPDGPRRVFVKFRDFTVPGHESEMVSDSIMYVAGEGEEKIYKWYFAEGYTGEGFQEYICLGNTGDADLEVEIDYHFSQGPSLVKTYLLPAKSRSTVNVNEEVGGGKEVSAVVSSSSPAVVCERPMYFLYGGRWGGGHDVLGASAPSRTWYFAEGYTGPGFEEWICVLNPGDSPCNLTFRFQTQEKGEIVRTTDPLPPHTRGSYLINDLLGPNYQCSLKLESDQPVVAERPMYFRYSGLSYRDWRGGHCLMGETMLYSSYYLAEGTTRRGFEEWLTLQNPNSHPITINAVYQLGKGQGDNVTKAYRVEGGRRFTVFVPYEVGTEKDVSVFLSSTDLFFAERPMYFSYKDKWEGGDVTSGAPFPSREWYFAEGHTGSQFEEWLVIQNPHGERVQVDITYIPGKGDPVVVRHEIDPASRYTIWVNENCPYKGDLSISLRANLPVMAERPIYFQFRPGMNGGHVEKGFAGF